MEVADHRGDIRDAARLAAVVREARPQIVFHLAAQPLVRRSYRDPLETWSTNVLGTANLLEACRGSPELRAIVAVTSDKCYRDAGDGRPHGEDDRLGGHDPYSASKAACELVAQSYRDAFFAEGATLLATARAGNVIGGGDWAEDRLVPDLVRAAASGSAAEIRSPEATRPWQHVLDSLSGYLALGARLLDARREFAQAWNFGPLPDADRTVSQVADQFARSWPGLAWRASSGARPHETHALHLDIAKARTRLAWRPVWSVDEAIGATADWYRAYLANGEVKSRGQLRAYCESARERGVEWAAA